MSSVHPEARTKPLKGFSAHCSPAHRDSLGTVIPDDGLGDTITFTNVTVAQLR